MNEKLQVALDEPYKDPTNLSGKFQKHQAFEAELAKNKGSIDEMTLVNPRKMSRINFSMSYGDADGECGFPRKALRFVGHQSDCGSAWVPVRAAVGRLRG